MKKIALIALTCLVCGSASGVGLSPVPGSSRPDAYGRAGQTLLLRVPEVAGRTVNVNGVPATISSDRVTVTLPAKTTPGRTVLRFANNSDGAVLTTREIDVLPPETTGEVQDHRVQLVLNPALSPERVRAILAELSSLGTLRRQETLPKPKDDGVSPCGGTLAEIELRPGITLEEALNSLLQGSADIMYPDPISTWGGPNAVQQAQPRFRRRQPRSHGSVFNIRPRP